MRWAAVALSWLCILTACSAPAPAEPSQPVRTVRVGASRQPTSPPVQAPQPASPALSGVVVRANASPAPPALPLSVVAGRSGGDVRVALDLLLQEQVFLTAQAMDAAASARLDELVGVTSTLDQNSLAVAQILGAVKDQTAAQTLLDAWRGLLADLISYAAGQQATAGADLDRRRPIIAAQLALDGFSAAQADELVQARVRSQLSLADAIVAHDGDQSTQRLRAAVAASDDLAQPLAAAIAARVPDQVRPPAAGPAVDVRVGLAGALQAHAYLTGAATDAAADGRGADLQELVSAANDSAGRLGAQLGDVYGSPLGDGVAERLKAETSALVSSASGGDRRQAVADLDRLRGEIDGLLAGANVLLPPGLLKQELRASDQALLTASDAFGARDFANGFLRLRDAARQSQRPADSLALSIVDRNPGRYFAVATRTPRS